MQTLLSGFEDLGSSIDSSLTDAFNTVVGEGQTASGEIGSAFSSSFSSIVTDGQLTVSQLQGNFEGVNLDVTNFSSSFESINTTGEETASSLQTSFENIDVNVGGFSSSFQQIETAGQEAAGNIQSSMTQASSNVTVNAPTVSMGSEETDKSTSSLKDNALAASQAATGIATLGMSVYNLEGAQTTLDKANVTVSRDTNAVQSATEKYNEAVTKYGPNSQQAKDASDRLSAAQAALTVAHERVTDASNNMNRTLIMTGLSVVPSVTSAITGVSSILATLPEGFSLTASATTLAGDAMEFFSSTLGIITIIGILIGALITAYETCKPFRDAINEIGSILEGALTTAFNDVKGALEYLWNNVFVPVGHFLGEVFQVAIEALMTPIDLLKDAFNDVKDALSWLWNNVLVPVGNFLEGAFKTAINGVMSVLKPLIDGVNTVMNVGKSIGGAIGGALKSIGLAEGGIVYSPTLALIGEAGPEAVVPLSGNNSSVLGASGVSPLDMVSVGNVGGAGSSPVTLTAAPVFHVTIQNGTNPQQILSIMTDAVRNGTGQAFVVATAEAQGRLQQKRS